MQSPQRTHQNEAKSQTKVHPGGDYRAEIDGLRAIAVIAVIINHFNESLLPSGYLGVDVFFVISGYVITLSLSKTRSTDVWSFASSFFKRRIKRLAPALFTCITITAALACLFNDRTASHINTGIAALIGTSNIYLHSLSTDYFAESTKLNPFTQTWSLGIEEQFYLIFPWLAWFLWLRATPSNAGRKRFTLFVAALCTASLSLYLALAANNPSAAYFLLPSRLWELGAGCLTFLLLGKRPGIKLRVRGLDLSYGPLLCLIAIFIWDQNQQFLTVTAVILTALALATPRDNPGNMALRFQPLIYIGLASYSLYLWHWSVLAISRWTIGIHLWSAPLQIALIAGLGITSYELIEKTTRKINWDPPFIWFFGSFLSVTLGASLALSWLGRPTSKIFLGTKGCEPFGLKTCKPIAEPHAALTPYIEGTTINRDNCIVRTEKSNFPQQVIQNCTTQSQDRGSRTIHLIGDSLAGNLTPILNKNYQQRRGNAAVLVKYACGLNSPKLNTTIDSSSCDLANQQRWNYLRTNVQQNDIIIVASSDLSLNQSTSRTLSDLARIADRLGAHIIAMTPAPDQVFPKEADTPIQQCINSSSQWFNSSLRNECRKLYWQDSTAFKKQHQELIEFMRQLEDKHRFFHAWDISKDICSLDKCPSEKDGIRLYRDLKHFSLPAAETILYKSFQELLSKKSIRLP